MGVPKNELKPGSKWNQWGTPGPGGLFPRERECLRLIRQGYGYRRISKKLGLGCSSVINTVRRAQAKLGVYDHREAAEYAASMGYLSEEE